MNKLITVVISAVALMGVQVRASTLFNISAANLYDNSGLNLLPQNSLVIFVVDTTGNGFSAGLAAGDSLLVGQSLHGGDDLIIARMDLTGSGQDGALSGAATVDYAGAVGENDPVAIYWFSGATLGNTTAQGNMSYGTYTDAIGIDSSARWALPADTGAALQLIFFTQAFGGSNPEIAGMAGFAVIPEPSTFVLVGLGLVSLMVIRRRHYV